MRAVEDWRPTKFELRGGRLRASRDPDVVGVGSRLITDLVADAYQQMLRDHATGTLLDFGCGSVPLYGVYADRVVDTTCVDWSASRHEDRHVDVAIDLTTGAPELPSTSFDTILATDVLEHLPSPELVWGEFDRLLRPGGKVLLGVPFTYWLHETPHDYYRYTEHALRRHAEAAGFTVTELRPYGGPLEILVDIIAKATTPVPVLSSLVTALGTLLRRVPPVRRASSAWAVRMPLGYVGVFAKGDPSDAG